MGEKRKPITKKNLDRLNKYMEQLLTFSRKIGLQGDLYSNPKWIDVTTIGNMGKREYIDAGTEINIRLNIPPYQKNKKIKI